MSAFSFRGNDVVREAINAAFLYHAINAGLDMGIVNAGQLEIYEEIPKDLLEHVEDVLLNRRPDATDRLLEFAETVKDAKKKGGRTENLEWRNGTVEERLSHALIKGIDKFVVEDTEEARQKYDRCLANHRRPDDGWHVSRWRSVRQRKNVLAAGRQIGSRHEKSGRLSAAVHGAGKNRGRLREPELSRQDPDGYGQR